MDIYDIAIARLNKHPEELDESWKFPGDHPVTGCLFWNAGRNLLSFQMIDVENKLWLSDPISIKSDGRFVAENPRITDEIRRDNELPDSIDECRLQHLERLAYWQRLFDNIFKRNYQRPSAQDDDDIRQCLVDGLISKLWCPDGTLHRPIVDTLASVINDTDKDGAVDFLLSLVEDNEANGDDRVSIATEIIRHVFCCKDAITTLDELLVNHRSDNVEPNSSEPI